MSWLKIVSLCLVAALTQLVDGRSVRTVVWFALVAIVSACTAFVPSTVLDMRNIDRGRMDVTALAARMDLPVGLKPFPSQIALTVRVFHKDNPEGITETFVLTQNIQNNRITVAMRPQDKPKAIRLQTMGKDWAAQEFEGIRDNYSLNIQGCRLIEDIDLTQRLNIDVRWDHAKGFKPLMKGVRLKKLIGRDVIAGVQRC